MTKDVHGGNIWEAGELLGVKPEGLMDFSASINPLGMPEGAKRAVVRAIPVIPPYPDPASNALIRSLSEFHGVNKNELIAGNGSTEFIYLIPRALEPKKALIVEPAFSEYKRALTAQGCKAGSLVLKKDSFQFDIEGFRKALKGGCGLVWLANPANPTGVLTPKPVLSEAARLCRAAGATLVIDEAFIDFCPEGSMKDEAVKREGLIVLRSMTKFFAMAGLRLGYVIAHKKSIEKFARLLPPWTVNTLAGFAAIEALKDLDYIGRTRACIEAERELFRAELERIAGLRAFPTSANYLLVKIMEGRLSALELKAALLRQGFLIRELSAFKGLGPSYFRVAVRKREENRLLTSALGHLMANAKKIKASRTKVEPAP